MSDEKLPTAGSPDKRNAALRPDLVFRESPHDSCLVFALPERAAAVDRIHRAMESATSGEFRRKMDPEEYAGLHEVMFTAYRDAQDGVPREPEDDEPFSWESLPGFSDGDYPPWLALELERHLPNVILKALADSGLTVEEREDLVFW
jgi:hypothetical protein